VLSALTVPFMIYISKKFKLYDKIDERKIHTGNISRLGGVGILCGFTAAVIFFIIKGYFSSIDQNIWLIIPAIFMIIIMGIIDDLVQLKARIKLIIQIIATIIVILAGFKFNNISFGRFTIKLSWFSYIFTFCWIIGVTNAINLIDGLDGLSGSLSFCTAITYAIFAFNSNQTGAGVLSITLCASILGFLLYNLPLPSAKIFMGDGGSQFLGFSLAIIPLISQNGTHFISFPCAAAILIIPLFDTIAAIWRRLREHRRIDSPDRLHLHHKLLLLGFSKRMVLILIILYQTIISTLIILTVWLDTIPSTTLLITVYAMGILFFSIIHFAKNRVLEKLPE
jgi:UDP-GlcNAc:undecaprenyl-phosphate GlcNAc-1-phosphate transferase